MTWVSGCLVAVGVTLAVQCVQRLLPYPYGGGAKVVGFGGIVVVRLSWRLAAMSTACKMVLLVRFMGRPDKLVHGGHSCTIRWGKTETTSVLISIV